MRGSLTKSPSPTPWLFRLPPYCSEIKETHYFTDYMYLTLTLLITFFLHHNNSWFVFVSKGTRYLGGRERWRWKWRWLQQQV